ncbi:MAG: hypothetical protein FWG14_13770 [Peptococcaceae bacterium]|nr:hypothetical protein [Peptococcaceae bacterium]
MSIFLQDPRRAGNEFIASVFQDGSLGEKNGSACIQTLPPRQTPSGAQVALQRCLILHDG